MTIERERVFLVKSNRGNFFTHKRTEPTKLLEYGYIESICGSVCIRLVTGGEGLTGRLNVKDGLSKIARVEHEALIPTDMAEWIIRNQCHCALRKLRHTVLYKNSKWGIDEYIGRFSGLFLAEVELEKSRQAIDIPDWVGDEVTDIEAYKNENIAKHASLSEFKEKLSVL